jgi:DNA-binding protein H-NS
MTKFIFTPESDKMQFSDSVYLHTKNLMQKGKEFEVEFKPFVKSKSYDQLKGIHKLCEIYGNYMSEGLGVKVSFDNAKESLKYAIDYTRLTNKDEAVAEALRKKREKKLLDINMTITEFNSLVECLQKYFKVPASFKDATLEQMQELIEKVHELGRERGWHNLILTNQEMQEMVNYDKQLKKEYELL